MDEFESKFQNAKISALKEFYGKEKSGFEDAGRVGFENGKKVKFPQNQHTKISGNSLNDPDYLEILNERIWQKKSDGSLLYEDTAFRDLAAPNGNVITNREMRALQEAGYTAPRSGKKVNLKKVGERAKLRRDLDPYYIKEGAKKQIGRNKKNVIHHPLPKRLGETFETLIPDPEGKTLNSKSEFVLQNLDAEKQELLKEPLKNKKRINQIQSIEDRLKKGKNIPEVTSISTKTGKPVTGTNIQLKPEQKGLYGYENVSIDKKGNLTKKLKGVDTSQTVAGLSKDPLNKIDFRNVSPKDKTKMISKMGKRLRDLGFKCTVTKANGGPASCNNPLAYLDDIKKQQALAKTGKGPRAAKALKKISAGRKIFSAVLGPEALALELALIVPLAVADYKAGLPNQEILSNATLGLFGESRNRRRDKLAVKQGYDTKELKRSRDYDAAVNKFRGDNIMEYTQMSPDDLYQFPQQYNKSEEDLYKAIASYEGNKEAYNKDVKENESLIEILKLQDQRKAEDIKQRAQKSMEGPIDSFFASGGIAGLLKKWKTQP